MGWVHVVAILLVAGCNATPFTAASADAGPDTAAPADGGIDDGSVSCVQGSDSLCFAQTSKAECNGCCKCNHAVGAKTFNALQYACACGQPAPCMVSCQMTLCTDAAAPSAPCEKCVADARDGGACTSETMTCQVDPLCQGFVNCMRSCDQDH
jgi:hypothetical protein